MTPEQERDLNRRRQARLRKRKEAQQRQWRQLKLRLTFAALVLLLAVAAIAFVTVSGPDTEPGETTLNTTNPTDPTDTEATTGPTESTEATQPAAQTVIHIAAAGDLNVTDQVLERSMTEDGYDFTDVFLDVAPVLGGADLTMLNFEGNLSGAPYGTATGAAPGALPQLLAQMGVDVVQTANSACIRTGVSAIESTITGFESLGIQPVGTFRSAQEFRSTGGYTMVNVNGVRIAIVAFTKGMDNMGLPEGSESLVNLLYTDYTSNYKEINTKGITQVLKNAEEELPDLTIALVHWGSENNENISESQKDIRDLMVKNGVDAVIGTHSHLLQQMELDEQTGAFTAWSLGDLYGSAEEPGTNYSAILDLEITKDNTTGETKITGYSIVPIYTLTPEQSPSGAWRVVRMEQAIARYDAGYILRITDSAYDSVTYAYQRAYERTTPDEE